MAKGGKTKYYVVWRGHQPGIFTTWEEASNSVKGASGALYKSFKTRAEAEAAYASPPEDYVAKPSDRTVGHAKAKAKPKTKASALASPPDYRNDTVLPLHPDVEAKAWAVDAACSGNPGMMEYRCVCLQTGAVLFHFGPLFGTNNIGEFLAIVHAMAKMENDGKELLIYSDSVNAMKWVKAGKCKTTLVHCKRSVAVYDYIARAEKWLATHSFRPTVKKWNTNLYGEIPADFGRK